MNTLEAEYSFLTPTWKLPSVTTSSIYPHTFSTSHLSDIPTSGPHWTLWNGTTYNSRYIPSYVPSTNIRRNYPLSTNYSRVGPVIMSQQQQNYQSLGNLSMQSGPSYYQQTNSLYGDYTNPEDGLNLTISVHPNNGYESYDKNSNYGQSKQQMFNRSLTYSKNSQKNRPPINQKRHVQIIDHNRQTPSTVINENISERNSRVSNAASYTHYTHTPDPYKSQTKSKTPLSSQHHDQTDESKHSHDGNNFKVHDYLYGLSVPDPGSYTNAYKYHQRRLQDEKLGRKSVVSEYRSFARNGGFGPAFGNTNNQTYDDKIDTEHRRKTYSKVVHDTNQYKIEEQKRIQNQQEPKKNRPAPVPKHQRAREYANKIERPHHMKPVYDNMRLLPPTATVIIDQIFKPSLIATTSTNNNKTMPESLNHIDKNTSKEEKYKQIIIEIKHLIQHENDLIANLANISAILKEIFSFWWVGFYLVKNNQLVLGPFQGPLACTRIQLNKGVCGTSWGQRKTIVVKNVHEFPGHIACSSASLSEIVVPVIRTSSNDEQTQVLGVLDIDSEYEAHFDDVDQYYLEELVRECIEPCFS
ncbi:unnamed protein product [Rotaria sordida]|uniref:GAF domain-containing protein n=1 Tax=Rotaria sordida TaxID=392033 RepID=A0A813R9K6_9BILA|nr:unnamed protein product [Rotaria sordida]